MSAKPSIVHSLPGNLQRRITLLGCRTARIQFAAGGAFADSGLNRYGFIHEPDATEGDVHDRPDGESMLQTAGMRIRCRPDDPAVRVENAAGETVLDLLDAQLQALGSVARLRAAPAEDWMGFGDQTRERLFHRGHIADCHVLNVKSYIPVPFFMSTRGVGVLVNTTHRVVFDLCKSEPDQVVWRDGRGAIDFYVFVGSSFRELLDLYTALTGRPKLPPDWSFGLWYICRTQANDYEAVNDAVNFRREGIPCDVIGLEPGWMETFYDESTEKAWNRARFPIPGYARLGPHNFFNAIQRMHFHMELWLCCDYDLSYEAERRAGAAGSGAAARQREAFFQSGAEADEHFLQPRLTDKVTKRDEPWFQHLRKFVEQGIDFFKQDGAYQVLEHPDRLWGNGMPDAEMHNLYPLLYARQMLEGFEEQTGRRGLTFTPAGWAGFQAWAGTWTGDTGGRLPTLGALLNTAVVGHSWMTNDMEVAEKEGIHFGYLLPWSQINSWTYFRMPWVQGAELLAMHQDYSRLRARLIPYLYSWAYAATRTGFPLLAPLPLEFQDDPQCRGILHQYLLGRDLMVTIYRPDVHFPAGRWKDFWTGAVHAGAGETAIAWPANRGGGLFVREGALLPLAPVLQYRRERPLDALELYAFPGERESTFDYYEDDGVSLDHRSGAFATTPIRAVRKGAVIRIGVGAPKGVFAGQVAARTWTFTVAVETPPRRVEVGGRPLASEQWSHDTARGELVIQPQPGPVELTVTL